MNQVDISVEGLEPPPWLDRVVPFSLKVLSALGLDNWEVSIVLCSHPFIRTLNRKFRGKDDTTDVLSFPQGEDSFPSPEGGTILAGDIIISLDSLEETRRDFSVEPGDEIKRLLIHGILHLAGWDHRSTDPAEPMLVLQEELCRNFAEERIL